MAKKNEINPVVPAESTPVKPVSPPVAAMVTTATVRTVRVVIEVPLMADSRQRPLDVGMRVDQRMSLQESETYRALQNALAADGTLGDGYRRTATGEPLRWLCQQLAAALTKAKGENA